MSEESFICPRCHNEEIVENYSYVIVINACQKLEKIELCAECQLGIVKVINDYLAT